MNTDLVEASVSCRTPRFMNDMDEPRSFRLGVSNLEWPYGNFSGGGFTAG